MFVFLIYFDLFIWYLTGWLAFVIFEVLLNTPCCRSNRFFRIHFTQKWKVLKLTGCRSVFPNKSTIKFVFVCQIFSITTSQSPSVWKTIALSAFHFDYKKKSTPGNNRKYCNDISEKTVCATCWMPYLWLKVSFILRNWSTTVIHLAMYNR